MTSSTPSPRLVLGAAFVVAVLAVLAIRYLPDGQNGTAVTPSSRTAGSSATSNASSTVPAFGSAKFEGGDVFTALGPNWTFIRQNDAKGSLVFPGATSTRETLVKRVNSHAEMLLTELDVADGGNTLRDYLKKAGIDATSVQGQEGYVVPIASETGSSGFLLIGVTSALVIQVEDDQYGNLLPWPESLDPEIESYIWSVNVH